MQYVREGYLALLFILNKGISRRIKSMSSSKYFFCYNKTVSDFLKSKGIEIITVARDMKTDKIFSLYQIDDKLQKALDEYKSK
jgi:hypothetical protein